MTKVRKAVIPAAGLGTRFLPATKALAKEMAAEDLKLAQKEKVLKANGFETNTTYAA